ncbi:PASTA domain-containing protein [Cellulomonas bogoriensis]|uniref:PASTA domain-containing protein n=1 Tax=Cellulomonas bogoriensis 69B4 = DSM 16987 TaxID=1386082 RepID=A0A0A0C014_9CELL|nr:PASTA domain-containing protein [Cellulomonas bogoriensis]KGM13247.1 hypothetical protein N869_15395 [Cellulomonas bogoriensis 69B4 = DSM 16987]
MNTTVRTGLVALVAAGALVLAGCAEQDEETTVPTDDTDVQTDQAQGTGEVPDVTVLILETAQGNLTRLGLEVEVVDEDGQPVEAEDASQWRVTDQDPVGVPAEEGDVITLTVVERG